jgi:hypothetical protein
MENISFYDDIYTNEELDWLLQNEIVTNKREQLSETTHKIRFSIDLPETMITKLQSLGLESNIKSIPMMWINNDMTSHVDTGNGEFDGTLLVYVTDTTGSLLVDNKNYEIRKNRAFRFQKGLEHSTENTGNEPRLLIGPMSEFGFPVGSIAILYYSSSAYVIPYPDYNYVVYADLYVAGGANGIISTSTTFPDNSTIPPPYQGAILLGWAGVKDDGLGGYTSVNYNPGDVWINDGYNTHLYPVWTQSQQQNIMCFKEGTQILCLDQVDGNEKYIPIEELHNGVLVKTLYSGYQPICMIGKSRIYNPGDKLRGKNRLYKCSKEKYPELFEDLVITGCHSILVYNITDKQREDLEELMGKIYVTEKRYRLMACVDERAEPYQQEGLYTIWHFALEHEHIRANYGVYANGLLVESSSKRMMSQYSGMTLLP